jgi:predicted ABC-type ATPase
MITVIAGVNGAGKSTIAGARLRKDGGDYFNPDEAARELIELDNSLTLTEANSKAWKLGFEQLCRAIDENANYIFETTLGGNSITQKLLEAIDSGQDVRIFYCGLTSPQLHIERVRSRVEKGGHHILDTKIHQRWTTSIHNMLTLIPLCSEVKVLDNSAPADEKGIHPVLVFTFDDQGIELLPIEEMPTWAKPLAARAMKKFINNP